MNKHTLLNRSRTRKFALAYAKDNRYAKYTRISETWYDRIEAKLKETIRHDIHRQPSMGVTLK